MTKVKQRPRNAFTLIEVVIVIALIAILTAILIPAMVKEYDEDKTAILNLYHENQIEVVDQTTNEVLYAGEREGFNLCGYVIVDANYRKGVVVLTVTKEQNVSNEKDQN